MNTSSSKLPLFHILYVVSFIEGGALMAVELLGSKMIAPYYGASLYVWTAVLGTTLGGLALGYWLGGSFTEKYESQINRILLLIFVASGVFMLILPFYGKLILEATVSMSLKPGIVISSFLILTPILCSFGMVSPLIIHLLSKQFNVAGPAAGTIYGVSTVGGVIFSLVFGLYFIPFIGIKAGMLFIGSFLLLGAGLMFLAGRNTESK